MGPGRERLLAPFALRQEDGGSAGDGPRLRSARGRPADDVVDPGHDVPGRAGGTPPGRPGDPPLPQDPPTASRRPNPAACRGLHAGGSGGDARPLRPRTPALPAQPRDLGRARPHRPTRLVSDVRRLGRALGGPHGGRGAAAANGVRGARAHGRTGVPLDDRRVPRPCRPGPGAIRRGGASDPGL